MSRTINEEPIEERWDRLHELDRQRLVAWEAYRSTTGAKNKSRILDRIMRILEEERAILAMPYPLSVVMRGRVG